MDRIILLAMLFSWAVRASEVTVCVDGIRDSIEKIFEVITEEWRYDARAHVGYDALYAYLCVRQVRIVFTLQPETVFDEQRDTWDWTFRVVYHLEGVSRHELLAGYYAEVAAFEHDVRMVSVLLEALLSELFRSYCATREQLFLAQKLHFVVGYNSY